MAEGRATLPRSPTPAGQRRDRTRPSAVQRLAHCFCRPPLLWCPLAAPGNAYRRRTTRVRSVRVPSAVRSVAGEQKSAARAHGVIRVLWTSR